MTENYLDITKSAMISAPAGSGKTEKLARRYIELVKSGSDVERILAITFTEKAAAEMKERILNILKKEDSEMFGKVREKMPRMRISTIHSFCLKLLKRFSLELGIDPSLEVMDTFNADILWSEAIYETLLEDGSTSGERLFYSFIKDNGIKGWNKLYRILNELHVKRPVIELGSQGLELGDRDYGQNHFGRIFSIYLKCLQRYKQKKMERHCLDYNDLELMAYEAISANPEWQNVLYSFDEHTDHILVDEFQDTSLLQWSIIDKLTEEWRSGRGAKREAGVNPTIFLVGDDKQSIYSFRGADVSIFKNAKTRLAGWLGDRYHFVEIRENYRSLPVIIDFVNNLFEKLMPKGLYDDYKVEYIPFEAARDGDGGVELILLESIGKTKENRKAEANAIAKKIKELAGRYEIYDADCRKRTGRYGDMAILLRNRTHLSVFEDAMRREGIPFVVVKGIGFYSSPEVCIMRNTLFFLIDPMDDYSLFNILRSPLFSVGYDVISRIIEETETDRMPAGYLFDLLRKYSAEHTADTSISRNPAASLSRWLERARHTRYSILLEEILSETGAWQYFHEKQRYMNVKKFIKLVEGFEQRGLTGLEIREKLIKASVKSDEAKANVNIEGMDAVRIMTVHASKGLQFPMVFLPCLDEDRGPKGLESVVTDRDENGIVIAYEDDSNMRKKLPIFQKYEEKVSDEEKRLFYVAVTRAMDYLCMSGVLKDSPSGKLSYLVDAGFRIQDSAIINNIRVERISRKDSEDKPDIMKSGIAASAVYDGRKEIFLDETVFIEHLDYKPSTLWLNVTEEIDEVRRKHGDDWVVLGRAFHGLFEGISKGYITMDNLENKIVAILRNEVLSDRDADRMTGIILSGTEKLKSGGYLSEIIMPQADSYSELPFVLGLGNRVYNGRIDRVVMKEVGSQQHSAKSKINGHRERVAYIYDYKTYPISEGEIPELLDRYSFQMDIYRKAVERLFKVKTKNYIFFTHEPRLVPVA